MTPVGYGDFVPITDAGKIFTMFFSVIGVGSALYFFSLVGGVIFRRHIERHNKKYGRNSLKRKR